MRLIAIAVVGFLFAATNLVSASPLNSISPGLDYTPVELVPVSYTHLDVYKRQELQP